MVDGRLVRAHRFSYERAVGPIPAGLQIDHLCRVRACVNPAHLEPVTCGENVRRSWAAMPRKPPKTHCVHGHAYTPENTHIRKNGAYACLACNAIRCRRYQATLRGHK